MTLHIRDANDNVPKFERPLYRATVPENAAKGTEIAIFKATDIDDGMFGTQGIRYTEVKGDLASKLALDPVTGKLTVAVSDAFDREAAAQHTLLVEARDNNGTGNRNSVQLIITLVDVNDNEPTFKPFKQTVSLPETAAPGLVVDVLEAIDPDEGQFGQIAYRLEEVDKEPSAPPTFIIDNKEGKGHVQLVGRLDFERKSLYQLKVLAFDRALEGEQRTATVSVEQLLRK